MRHPTAKPTEGHQRPPAVPSLEIAARLQAVSDGGGEPVSLPPSSSGLRVGLVALAAAVLIAGAAFMFLRGSSGQHPSSHVVAVPEAAYLPVVHTLPVATGRYAASTASGARLTIVSASPLPKPPKPKVTPQAPLELSTSQLLATDADGASPFTPPSYLASAFETAARTYGVPWRLLAAIEYIDGRYSMALAGVSSTPVSSTQVRPQALAASVAATEQPSAALFTDARRLAADGAANSPATAIAAYTRGDPSAQEVLTVAQQINSTSVTATTGPLAKVVAMQNEAHLLNGLPYIWGGGHTEPAWVVGAGYDCSGFVSEVLHSAGYLSSPDTTQTLPGSSGIVSGAGKYVTIYDRTIATVRVWEKKKVMKTVKRVVNPAAAGVHLDKGRKSNADAAVSIRLPKWVGQWETVKITKLVRSADTTNNDEHVIVDLDGQWWESGGSAADGGAEEVHRIVDPNPAYLKSFNRILHPAGL